MPITHLDHVNIQTTRLARMTTWYSEILGLTPEERPNFPFPGAWLYANGKVMVHLVGIADPEAVGSEHNLKLEHFAFKAHDEVSFEKRLKISGQRYRRIEIASINTVAFNVWDPDGNHIHVDFMQDQ